MAKARLTPQEIVDKQISRAAAAVGDYKKGIQNTTKDPMRLAIAKKDKAKANYMAALDSGRWEAGLNSVSQAQWKELTATKGGDRWAAGIQAAKPKITKFQTTYAPMRQQLADQVNQMPDDTFEQRLAKSRAMQIALHDNPYKTLR